MKRGLLLDGGNKKMDKREQAVQAGINANAMLYDKNREDAKQLYFLYDLALLAPDGIGVEVGAYQGGSIACWGMAKERKIYAVDNWATHSKANKFRLFENTKHLSVSLIECPSWEGANRFNDNAIAFCFIDADHSIRGIGRDILVWPQKIMNGGIIAFHDYGAPKKNIAVKCLVDCWQAEVKWECLGVVGSTIGFRKSAVDK
jgi:predicted O-methyltransferase YrrM